MIKRHLRHLLTLIARWVVANPRRRQRILALLERLPPAVEKRLRRAITPAPPGGAGERVIDELSPLEKRLRRDLANRQDWLRRHGEVASADKPALAYFSPLPPEKSGISNYSLMLIPQLLPHYRVTLIVDQLTSDLGSLSGQVEVKTWQWFPDHAGEFDRILYHFGNSPFHSHMFEALARWPGAVVLHDFFLGHVVGHLNAAQPGYLLESLYQGWGLTALLHATTTRNHEGIIWDCPLNAAVLRDALGMIVHSEFSRELAHRHFGDACQQQWHIIPHLREPAAKADKAAVRALLGLPANAFVVCSFGHITPTKLHQRILDAWTASTLQDDTQCWLVFVGELPQDIHGDLIGTRVKAIRNSRIRITGWTDDETFEHYLALADLAIQLRSRSRGETSGAVIDCLNHGVATIVNAHGTMADLPGDTVLRLPDEFAHDELVAALEQLRSNQVQRLALGERGRDFIRRHHAPAACGQAYAGAIESIYHAQQPYQGGLDHYLHQPQMPDLPTLAHALSNLMPTGLGLRQLLVDVSALVHADLQTGIERVARSQLLELIRQPPAGYRVEPVYLHQSPYGWQYQYARAYGLGLLQVAIPGAVDEKVDFAAGDILYTPDFNAHSTICAHADGLFSRIRSTGTSIHVLIHDLLPVTHPECFPPDAMATHQRWLDAITAFADQVICISHAVADRYRTWLDAQGKALGDTPRITVNHHGADIGASNPTRGIPGSGRKILRQLAKAPTFVMVGTVEPRKGHLETLAAFDQLWQAGTDANLVIVGREGWRGLPDSERRTIPDIIRKLDWHPQRNKKLFWLADISDEYLEAVYTSSRCLIAASADEGFGLPLIEAAQHGLPIIARDIPVFREVAADRATYFDSASAPLADVLKDWLSRQARGETLSAASLPIRTWQENVATLKSLLLAEHETANIDDILTQQE